MPGSGDDVVINLPGITVTHNQANTDSINSLTSNDPIVFSTGSLAIADNSTINNSLTLSDGTLTFGTVETAANLTVTGLLTWAGGTMSGTGIADAQGGIALSGAGSSSFDEVVEDLVDRTLQNDGVANWTGAYDVIYLENGTVWNNEPGSVLNAQANQVLFDNSGGGTFVNSGTLEKTAGTGSTGVEVPDTNTGSISAQSGTLLLSGGTSTGGSFTAASGAALGLFFGVLDAR